MEIETMEHALPQDRCIQAEETVSTVAGLSWVVAQSTSMTMLFFI